MGIQPFATLILVDYHRTFGATAGQTERVHFVELFACFVTVLRIRPAVGGSACSVAVGATESLHSAGSASNKEVDVCAAVIEVRSVAGFDGLVDRLARGEGNNSQEDERVVRLHCDLFSC